MKNFQFFFIFILYVSAANIYGLMIMDKFPLAPQTDTWDNVATQLVVN